MGKYKAKEVNEDDDIKQNRKLGKRKYNQLKQSLQKT